MYIRLYGNINSRLRRLLCRPYTDHTPFPSPRHGMAFQAFFDVPFQTTTLSHLTDGGANSDKASWNLLLSMFSLPFGLSPCQFLSFLRHRQPFLQLTVHPVSGLNRSGGIFFPLMSMCISRCCKRCQPPFLLHPLSTFHFKSVHAFFSFFR